MMEIIKGDLIKLALEGQFDVIAHGCNCFCRMKRGIAPKMAEAFHCDTYSLEDTIYEGSIYKLGQIQDNWFEITEQLGLHVVNMYTQYHWSDADPTSGVPLNYAALGLCLMKVNHEFKGEHIGLPWVGCGLAGGDKDAVRRLIELIMKDCKVTIVEYEQV